MRLLASALIALACLSWSAAPADARSREQAQAQPRQAAPQANRAAAARAAAAPQRQAAQPQRQATRQAPTATRTPAATRQAAARPPAGRAAGTRQAANPRDARGARQAAARSGGRQQVAASTCRGRNCAPRTRTVSWQGGLEPATNAQAHACPAGTLATLAIGHSDIVRCMPL
jgi:hypothetical protein